MQAAQCGDLQVKEKLWLKLNNSFMPFFLTFNWQVSRWDQEWTHIYSKQASERGCVCVFGWISPLSPLHHTCSQSVHLSLSTCPLQCSKRLNVSFQTLTQRQIMQIIWWPSMWTEPLIKYLTGPKQTLRGVELDVLKYIYFSIWGSIMIYLLLLCEPEGAGRWSSSEASLERQEKQDIIFCHSNCFKKTNMVLII